MSRGLRAGDPLETARKSAAAAGECPINHIDQFARDHWDCCEICSWFNCEACVATPEDFGWHDPDEEEAAGGGFVNW